jgi:hypothetical protein
VRTENMAITLVENFGPGSVYPPTMARGVGHAVHDAEGELEPLPPHFRMIAGASRLCPFCVVNLRGER